MTSIFAQSNPQNKAEIPIKTRVINGFQYLYPTVDGISIWALHRVHQDTLVQLGQDSMQPNLVSKKKNTSKE